MLFTIQIYCKKTRFPKQVRTQEFYQCSGGKDQGKKNIHEFARNPPPPPACSHFILSLHVPLIVCTVVPTPDSKTIYNNISLLKTIITPLFSPPPLM